MKIYQQHSGVRKPMLYGGMAMSAPMGAGMAQDKQNKKNKKMMANSLMTENMPAPRMKYGGRASKRNR